MILNRYVYMQLSLEEVNDNSFRTMRSFELMHLYPVIAGAELSIPKSANLGHTQAEITKWS